GRRRKRTRRRRRMRERRRDRSTGSAARFSFRTADGGMGSAACGFVIHHYRRYLIVGYDGAKCNFQTIALASDGTIAPLALCPIPSYDVRREAASRSSGGERKCEDH